MSAAQGWTFDSAGRLALHASTTARARAAGSDLCVSVGPGKDPSYGFPLAQLQPCSAVPSEQLAPTTAGQGPIRSGDKGDCLDVSNHDKAEGAPVGFYACTSGSANQQWTVRDTPSHDVQIVVAETGFCLTAC